MAPLKSKVVATSALERPENKKRLSPGIMRKRMLSAARKLVSEVGFQDAQVAAVARRAGIAIGTVYRYFPSKTDLMVEVCSQVARCEVEIVARVAMSEGEPTQRLAASIWVFVRRALRGQRLAHACMVEPVEAELEAIRFKYRHKLSRIYESIIDQGIGAREFPRQNAQASAACIVGSLFEGLIGALALEDQTTDEERRWQAIGVVEFCMRGVSGGRYAFSPENADEFIKVNRHEILAP